MKRWRRNPLSDAGVFRRAWFIPRPFWRQVRLLQIAFFVPLAILLAMVLVPRGSWTLPATVLSVVAGLLWEVYPRWAFVRLKRKLARYRFRLCLWCGYRLRGLPDDHKCPECGMKYHAPYVRHAWRQWVKTGKLPEGAVERK
jgi:hypothetical protein